MIYALCLLLILIGLYGVVVGRSTIKIVLAIMLMEHGVHLLIVLLSYRAGGRAPIMQPGAVPDAFAQSAVDPLPQALVLTSIVIGLGTLALMVALCLKLYERYGTFDIDAMRRLKG